MGRWMSKQHGSDDEGHGCVWCGETAAAIEHVWAECPYFATQRERRSEILSRWHTLPAALRTYGHVAIGNHVRHRDAESLDRRQGRRAARGDRL